MALRDGYSAAFVAASVFVLTALILTATLLKVYRPAQQ
jgi:hypothetical protein